MAEAYRCTRLVEFNDTDMAGIAHFTAFFRWMEEAETAFLRSRGMTVLGEWQGQKVSLPRVAVSCEFSRAVSFGDEMTIVVTVEKVGRTSLMYAFQDASNTNAGVGNQTLPEAGYNTETREDDLIFHDDYIASSSTLNQASIVLERSYDPISDVQEGPQIRVNGNYVGGSAQNDQVRTEYNLRGGEMVTWTS